MILVIGFEFEVVGMTCVNHLINLLRSACGFVIGLSQLLITCFMLHVMWFFGLT